MNGRKVQQKARPGGVVPDISRRRLYYCRGDGALAKFPMSSKCARCRRALTCAFIMLVIQWCRADWPMHRGDPQLQGRADIIAPAKAELAWTFTAGKPIKGAAAISHGRVFVGDDAGILHAVDLTSGK
jgi:PQQ-like domain